MADTNDNDTRDASSADVAPTNAASADGAKTEQAALSRRDFLRRASRDAVDTTAKIVPGGNLVRAAVGADGKTPWWQKMASWRQTRPDKDNPKPETAPDTQSEKNAG